jgi:predicted alpha-1,6-mannanase (GH76 family)
MVSYFPPFHSKSRDYHANIVRRWDKAQTYVNAIANELYITTAIKLANRAPNTPSPGYYMNEAQRSWDWFWASGMINSQNLVNDGLTSAPACQNNGIEEFTYNQGVILSALTEFAWATNNQTYNDLANTLALAGIAHFTDSNGILHEPCEPNACDGDEEQFKGVFGRNVQFMVNRMNSLSDGDRQTYVGFLQTNANAIWSEDQVSNQLGLVWSGPGGTATVQTQSSALDVIVGAACVS